MKIVVVGGGTAGWIAAYFLMNDHPGDHEIHVIESSKIGIIGAGEGSTGTMLELLNGSYFPKSVDVQNFLDEVDGTIKQGIYHQNWNGDGKGYFAPIDTSPTWFKWEDEYFKYVLSEFGTDKLHLASRIGIEYENRSVNDTALHFDGHKVGKFFKRICQQNGVKVYDNVVDEIYTDTKGNITKLLLDDGKELDGDFFIDCSGFARILSKKVGIKWKSYSDYLPVNTAMPFIIQYEPGEQPNPYTKATALSSGWMWEIPLKTRKGQGYVYDNRFITNEQAQQEVEEYLGKKIEPIKFINFDSGRSEDFWKNNVLTLGLCSAFVEPLEATSIHSTIIQLLIFSKEFCYKDKTNTVTRSNADIYNEKIGTLYDTILDFISYHYQSKRNDSEFWQHIHKNDVVTEKAKHFLRKSKKQVPGFLEINGIIGSPSVGLWNWISAGLEIVTPEQCASELGEKRHNIASEYANFYNSITNTKSYIQNI